MVTKYISPFLKAHVAGIVAAVSLVISDLTNGGINTADQWTAIVGAFVVGFGLTAIVPNTAVAAVAKVVEAEKSGAPVVQDVEAAIKAVASAIAAPPAA